MLARQHVSIDEEVFDSCPVQVTAEGSIAFTTDDAMNVQLPILDLAGPGEL